MLPYLRRWVAEVRDMGCFAILHTDGDVTPYMEDIANSGVHALQAIDPVAGMDIRKVKEQVGDRLCGNVDCGLLLNGSPQKRCTQPHVTCCSTAKLAAAWCWAHPTRYNRKCRSRTTGRWFARGRSTESTERTVRVGQT